MTREEKRGVQGPTTKPRGSVRRLVHDRGAKEENAAIRRLSDARILTVTFNPAIDWNLTVDGIGGRRKHAILGSHKVCGGKGVNVSRVLNRLGTPNRAFVVLGGANGRLFRKLARRDGISLQIVALPAETRTNLTIVGRAAGRQIKIDQPGPRVGAAQLRRIRSDLKKAIQRASIVVYSGSLPPGLPPRFLCDCIRDANRMGKRTVLDTSGPALRAAKQVRLWLLKPNQEEWNSIRRSTPKAEWTLVTRGRKGAELRGIGRLWKATARVRRKICTVGAGDSLLAGFLHDFLRTNDPEKALRFGVICGAASVSNPAGRLADTRSIRKILRSRR